MAPTYPRWVGHCQLCQSVGRKSVKYQTAPDKHPVCPRCDRLQCGSCKKPTLDPFTNHCLYCGRLNWKAAVQ
jgi:hypothetical protein